MEKTKGQAKFLSTSFYIMFFARAIKVATKMNRSCT